jgi:hypothetical protein
VDDDLPEWAGRQLLADALRSCGVPWVPGAWWRRPADRWMTPADTSQAIDLEGRVVAEARRRLPRGVSGRAIGQTWRDAAWRCIVAGLALLDAEARERIACDDDHERELLVASPTPKVLPRADQGRSVPEPRPTGVSRMTHPTSKPRRVTWEARRRG